MTLSSGGTACLRSLVLSAYRERGSLDVGGLRLRKPPEYRRPYYDAASVYGDYRLQLCLLADLGLHAGERLRVARDGVRCPGGVEHRDALDGAGVFLQEVADEPPHLGLVVPLHR